jgi:hypothetical protein
VEIKAKKMVGTLTASILTMFVFLNGMTASAGTILSPEAVIANTLGVDSAPFANGFMIDQSGLSAGFTSGFTDFDTYIGTSPTHVDGGLNVSWFSPAFGGTTGSIDYDLGSSVKVSQIVLWPDDFSGPSGISVFTSDDSLFTLATLVGTLSPSDPANSVAVPGEVFDLLDTTARYVRLSITSGFDTGDQVGIGEVAFDVTIPEPSVLTIFGLGLSGLGVMMRRRRKAVAS